MEKRCGINSQVPSSTSGSELPHSRKAPLATSIRPRLPFSAARRFGSIEALTPGLLPLGVLLPLLEVSASVRSYLHRYSAGS